MPEFGVGAKAGLCSKRPKDQSIRLSSKISSTTSVLAEGSGFAPFLVPILFKADNWPLTCLC